VIRDAMCAALAASVFSAALGGCSESASHSASSGSGACERACAVCQSDPCADCASASERFRPEVSATMFSCVAGADACSPSLWASCLTQGVGQVSRRSIDDSYRDACMQKRQECEAQGVSFADDDCLLSHMFTEAWVSKAQACLAKSCSETRTCLGEIFY